MIPPPEFSSLPGAEKDALIATLLWRLAALKAEVVALRAENSALRAENAELRAENAALREKLKLLPKMPDNASTPPSRGHKTK
jgi:cell division protein FtsB